jgi:hypothetical protein
LNMKNETLFRSRLLEAGLEKGPLRARSFLIVLSRFL